MQAAAPPLWQRDSRPRKPSPRRWALASASWKEIEIVKGPRREPILLLHGNAHARAKALELSEWAISLSHTHEHAVALVVAWKVQGDGAEADAEKSE
jgi:hypothetical protein